MLMTFFYNSFVIGGSSASLAHPATYLERDSTYAEFVSQGLYTVVQSKALSVFLLHQQQGTQLCQHSHTFMSL